jgi:cyclopropane-fatty-acyl-phospholipid synthase
MSKERLVEWTIQAMEKGWVPEFIVRMGIRKLCRKRLNSLEIRGCEETEEYEDRLYQDSIKGPIAHVPEKANEQHYEVPAEFYDFALGPRRKYSSCFWDQSTRVLGEAETRSLELTAQHADIRDGQRVLELGCGWGSCSLFLLQRFPNLQVTAVSNSASQREYIYQRATELGVRNRITIITADMNDFDIEEKFDRIVSIEMFEHMRNYRKLLRKCAEWLEPNGKLMVHVFCHRHFCYPFEEDGAANWMGRYFFSGGLMPSDSWFYRFQDDLRVTRQWRWSGEHYQRTAEAWLDNMKRNRRELLPILAKIYPGQSPEVWYRRWRILFLAGAELFGERNGQEWWVSHYLFEPQSQPERQSVQDSIGIEFEEESLVGVGESSLE